MLLATIALAAQVAANSPARTEVARPCADASALCRISPFFCPGTYPQGLEPCWPEARETRTLKDLFVQRGRTAPTTPVPVLR